MKIYKKGHLARDIGLIYKPSGLKTLTFSLNFWLIEQKCYAVRWVRFINLKNSKMMCYIIMDLHWI
jgi:hypothetical protein